MFEPLDLLRTYLQGIRYFTGAVSASLFVPAKLGGTSSARLLHSGEHRPLPELETLSAAEDWAKRAEGWIEEAVQAHPGPMPVPFASVIAEGAMFALPDLGSLGGLAHWAAGDEANELDGSGGGMLEQARKVADQSGAWLGLRFAPGSGTAAENLANTNHQRRWLQDGTQEGRWHWLFAMGGAMASHSARVAGALCDPQTGLLNRAGLQALLNEKLEEGQRTQHGLSLLFLNPDDFAAINEDLGRAAAEQCVREISARLSQHLPAGQIASRFGGVVFAALLNDVGEQEAQAIGEELRGALSEKPYLGGSVDLTFSCGISSWDPAELPAPGLFELVRRADESLLHAKEKGGGTLAIWSHDESGAEPLHFDRLTGIFTGNQVQDYRNMAILWDAIEAVSVGLPFEKLSVQMVDQIYRTFRARHVALFRVTTPQTLELVAQRLGSGCPERNLLDLDTYRDLLHKAGHEGGAGTLDPNKNSGRFAAAVGLNGQDGALGCLFIEAQQASPLEAEDLMFLRALGNQLGVALERVLTAHRKKKEEDRARHRLEQELEDLRRTVNKGRLVVRSPEMQELLDTARRVAPIDATVLITGSSGTGKEVLASTIHDLSPRRDKPMVVVDCGAISTTLIESELFGHEKGAYTGAQSRRQGRLSEANNGTLFLDEVGELPLEVQSKLLRFVQERQLTAVGGGRTEQVDVRIIAATNRDLEQEVDEGRFRADLFYRLNVVRLHIADLKDRPEDLHHLAEHFLEHSVSEYDREIFGFDEGALAALGSHPWPGNVRELKNRILRACILAESEFITASDLGLSSENGTNQRQSKVQPQVTLKRQRDSFAEQASRDASVSLVDGDASVMSSLEAAIAQQILDCKDQGGDLPPLGRWIYDDLLLEAQAAADGVARQAANLIGVAETTFRRRIRTIEDQNRTDRWPRVRALLTEAIEKRIGGPSGLVAEVENLLLTRIVAVYPRSTARGAALLGVSAPTFRSKLAKLHGLQPAGAHASIN